MPLVDLPPDAQPDPPPGTPGAPPPGTLADLPPGAQPDAPPPGWLSGLGQGTATAILKGIGGLGGLPNTIGQLGDTAIDAIRRNSYGPAEVTGQEPPPDAGPGWLARHTYSPQDINQGIFGGLSAASQAMGGKPIQPYEATSGPGKVAQAIGEQVIPSIVGGPETLIPRLVAGMTGGGAGEAARQLFPDSTAIPFAASVLGAMAGGKVGGSFSGETTPLAKSYDRLGIDPLAGDVTQKPLWQQTQAAGAGLPGGGRIHGQMEKSLNQWTDALDNTAGMLGGSKTLQQVGESAQAESEQWLNRFRTTSKSNWNDVDMHIPASTPTPVPSYETALQDVRTQMPGAPATAAVLEPSLTKDLLTALTSDTRVPARNTGLLDAQGRPIMTPATTKPLTWQDVQGIRRQIGDRLADPATYSEPGAAQLKQLYGALSTDQEALAAAQGTAASDAFSAARDHTREGHDFIDTTLSKISRGNQIDPEQAARNLLTSAGAGGSMLDRVRANMPNTANEAGAYTLRDMGLATAGRQDATMARGSPNSFMTGYANLAPEARDALFGNNPALQQKVQDLLDVSGSMRKTEQAYFNTSKTAGAEGMRKGLGGLATAPAAAGAGYMAAGIPGAVAGGLSSAALPFVPGYLAGQLTARPGFARALAREPAPWTPSLGRNFPVQGLLGFPSP